MFEKDMRLPLLLDHYGELLGEHRREIFEMYYADDLSLAEIAENTGISRQGVRESLKKSEAELRTFEDALHLAQRSDALRAQCGSQADRLEAVLAAVTDPAAAEAIRQSIQYLRNIQF